MRLSAVFVVVLTIGGLAGCAGRRPGRSDYGIPRCPSAPSGDLLADDALQCWFEASHGRWRTVSHESHLDVLVVHVDARDPRDAEEITRRFVALGHDLFSEILVYAQPESPARPPRIRRVRWTRDRGFETLAFAVTGR